MKQLPLMIVCLTICLASCISAPTEDMLRKSVYLSGTEKYPQLAPFVSLRVQKVLPSTLFDEPSRAFLQNENKPFAFTITSEKTCVACISSVGIPQNIFVTPGDSLTFIADTLHLHIKGLKPRIIFRFSGLNAAHYNWGFMVDSVIRQPQIRSMTGKELNTWRKEIGRYKSDCLTYLAEYAKTYPVSNDFLEYAKSEIINRCIHYLYYHTKGSLGIDLAYKDFPEGYFDSEDEPSNPVSDSYRWAVEAKYLYKNSPAYKSQGESLAEMREYVLDNFDEELQEYLYTSIIGLAADSQRSEDAETFKQMVKDAPLYVEKPEYLEYIHKANEAYKP
jgi:hypothetical protein